MNEKQTEQQLKEFNAYAEMRQAADQIDWHLDRLVRVSKAKKHYDGEPSLEYYLDYLEGEVEKAVADFRIKRRMYLVLAGSESKEDQ